MEDIESSPSTCIVSHEDGSLKTEPDKNVTLLGSGLIHDGEVIEQMLLLHTEGGVKGQSENCIDSTLDDDDDEFTDNEFEEEEEEEDEDSQMEESFPEEDFENDEESSDEEEIFSNISIFEMEDDCFVMRRCVELQDLLDNTNECVKCKKKFRSLAKLNNHMKGHDDIKTYKCKYCDKIFSVGTLYKQHMKTHKENTKFVCTYCGKQFNSQYYLKSHEGFHFGQNSCSICKRSFCSSVSLKRHKKIHSVDRHTKRGRPPLIRPVFDEKGQEVYHCRHCNKAFGAANNVYRHEQTHKQKKSFDCTICGKSFTLLPYLNQHMKVHDDSRSFICQYCGKKFVESWYCRRHELVHTVEGALSCSFCPSVFTTLSNLKRHERKHTGEKPFQCRFCGRKFSENGTLQRHERIHTGFRPFSCKLCGKTFTVAHSMRRHEKTHTALRPFACHTCPKAYVDNMTLQKHLKIHMKEEDALQLPSESLQIVEEQQHENIIELPLLGTKEADIIVPTSQMDPYSQDASSHNIQIEIQGQPPDSKATIDSHNPNFLAETLMTGPFVQQVQLQDGRHVYATVWEKGSVGNWQVQICKPPVQSEVEVKTVSSADVLDHAPSPEADD